MLIFCALLSITCYSQEALTAQEEIYTVVEEMPSFPKGQKAMMKFIQKKIKFPKSAIEKKIMGKCFLNFVVGADGSLTDIKVIQGVKNCPECDDAAIKVISIMPKWIPRRQKGNAVAVYFNLPINFQYK